MACDSNTAQMHHVRCVPLIFLSVAYLSKLMQDLEDLASDADDACMYRVQLRSYFLARAQVTVSLLHFPTHLIVDRYPTLCNF